MSDLEDQIREIREFTASVRKQFLFAELQTCFTSLEMARFEISIGNLAVAKREAGAVQRGIQVIQRFLPELSAEERPEIESKLAELKAEAGQVIQQLNGP